jgi:MoxR-like ATPase
VSGASPPFASVAALRAALAGAAYLADAGTAHALWLGLALAKPVLLEGPPGCGKTEAARALAAALGADLVRLQCYEGIDAGQALYDWNYARQLLHLRTAGGGVAEVYSREFLVERPLLRALQAEARTVVLIDEIDRADPEFEAFLLEFLADFQVSIPEIGTIRAAHPPATVLTSNRTRELHDALRRRCLYHWIEPPPREREIEILRRRVPAASAEFAEAVVGAIERLRALDLVKRPGVAETIDWARALLALGAREPDDAALRATIGAVLKDEDDLAASAGLPLGVP